MDILLFAFARMMSAHSHHQIDRIEGRTRRFRILYYYPRSYLTLDSNTRP